jgi:hypothetical protein
MPLLALLFACAALVAGCGGGGAEGQIDLDSYADALAALRASEGDGQLHAARLEGDEITFDLVREGPATRVRWTGEELGSTGDDVAAGPYFDLSELTVEGARALLDAAPVEVERIDFTPAEDLRATVTVIGEGRTFTAAPDGSGLRELEPVG